MDDIDIYRSAKLLIDQYGSDALVKAANRANEMQERGDIEGTAVCNRITRAVAEIQSREAKTTH